MAQIEARSLGLFPELASRLEIGASGAVQVLLRSFIILFPSFFSNRKKVMLGDSDI